MTQRDSLRPTRSRVRDICDGVSESSAIALEVRGLTRRYKSLVAVDRLDLTVQTGDVYGFLGPNGAGKTTAIRCILGLIGREAGKISLFGDADLVRARASVGAIVETPAFHTWMSGKENLQLAAAYAGLDGKKASSEIARVLERVGLKERAKDKAGNYSLGMKQRLGIARALLGRPRLMVLDEPTNGLDPRGMREVRDLIRSLALNEQLTVLISSHLLAEVQAICNRVGIIQAGRLRAEGEVQELLAAGPGQGVLEVGAPDVEALRAVVDGMDGVEALGPGKAGRLQVRVGDVAVSVFNRGLVEAGIDVEALVPVERDLEAVFMEVTR